MRRTLTLLVLLLAAPPAASAQWPAAVAEMDRYVQADRIVGSALVLVEDGRIVAEHYTGLHDRNNNVAADRNTIWHWGSITKTLTAVAVRQLEQGSNRPRPVPDLLDRSAVEFVPELRRIHDPYGTIDAVTVRMLLSHSSGLRNGTWPWARGEAWEPFEPPEWDLAVGPRRGVGAVRTDRVGPARGDDALHAAGVRAREPLRLLEPRVRVPRPNHPGHHR